MDFKKLKNFVAVVDHGTFMTAAQHLNLSQPALSRSIQNLEEGLGVTLLERNTRGIRITPAGERLYQRAKFILSELKSAEQDTKTLKTARQLNIGVAPMFAGNLLPKALQHLHAYAPDLKINITSDLFPSLSDHLRQGEIDIALSHVPQTVLGGDVTVEPLIDVSVVYVASAQHDLARKQKLSLSELMTTPWAVVDEQHANELYAYLLMSEGMEKSPISVTTNSLTLLKSLITKPPYITLLPKHMVEDDIDRGLLSVLNVSAPHLARKAGLITRSSRRPNIDIDAFRAAVIKATEA